MPLISGDIFLLKLTFVFLSQELKERGLIFIFYGVRDKTSLIKIALQFLGRKIFHERHKIHLIL